MSKMFDKHSIPGIYIGHVLLSIIAIIIITTRKAYSITIKKKFFNFISSTVI